MVFAQADYESGPLPGEMFEIHTSFLLSAQTVGIDVSLQVNAVLDLSCIPENSFDRYNALRVKYCRLKVGMGAALRAIYAWVSVSTAICVCFILTERTKWNSL
jgi:hypothetical protein